MATIKEMAEDYRQAYLNAKHKGQLPPRLFFKQPSNKAEFLKESAGRYGKGFYTPGLLVDRNKDNPPSDAQHSTSPELILEAESFDGDMETAMERGYVGVRYSDDLYYLFPDTVQTLPKGEFGSSLHKHPLSGKETPIDKKGRKWYIRGDDKSFKSKEKAEAYLQRDMSFLNV